LATKVSCKETAEAFRTSWDKVFDAVEHVVTWGLEHRTLGKIDPLSSARNNFPAAHTFLRFFSFGASSNFVFQLV
jgi:hypothetical protein